MKEGINYCTSAREIGFRGVNEETGLARLIPISEEGEKEKEISFFFGVDVPTNLLPYLPDIGPESAFKKNGFWHRYKIKWAIFFAHLCPSDVAGSFKIEHILQAILFEGEETPRVFLDKRKRLKCAGALLEHDINQINEILKEKRIDL